MKNYMKNVVVVGGLPNENLGNQTHNLMKKSTVMASPKFIKPTCVVEVKKYLNNMPKLSKKCVGSASKQCANNNVSGLCKVSIPLGLVSVIVYANEVSKYYEENERMCRGQSVNSDVRELYRELYEKSL